MPIQPILDTEIETLKETIASNREHTTRAQYVAEVQPMKDELVALIAQNEVINAANKVIEDTPTAEELAATAAETRRQNIKTEIEKTYSRTDELGVIREALAVLLPENANVQAWNSVVLAAKAKYPKV